MSAGMGATEFCKWLLTLDDPEDLVGLAQRRTITLNQIIDKARVALELPKDGGGE